MYEEQVRGLGRGLGTTLSTALRDLYVGLNGRRLKLNVALLNPQLAIVEPPQPSTVTPTPLLPVLPMSRGAISSYGRCTQEGTDQLTSRGTN